MNESEVKAYEDICEGYSERHHVGIGIGYIAGRESMRAEAGLTKQTLSLSEQSNGDLERLLKIERTRNVEFITFLKELRAVQPAQVLDLPFWKRVDESIEASRDERQAP